MDNSLRIKEKRRHLDGVGCCWKCFWWRRHSHSAHNAAWMLGFCRFGFSSCPQSCPMGAHCVFLGGLRRRRHALVQLCEEVALRCTLPLATLATAATDQRFHGATVAGVATVAAPLRRKNSILGCHARLTNRAGLIATARRRPSSSIRACPRSARIASAALNSRLSRTQFGPYW